MKKRKLVIDDCAQCPHFDNIYYSYNEYCVLLQTKISKGPLRDGGYSWERPYPIPDNCPLEIAEDI